MRSLSLQICPNDMRTSSSSAGRCRARRVPGTRPLYHGVVCYILMSILLSLYLLFTIIIVIIIIIIIIIFILIITLPGAEDSSRGPGRPPMGKLKLRPIFKLRIYTLGV